MLLAVFYHKYGQDTKAIAVYARLCVLEDDGQHVVQATSGRLSSPSKQLSRQTFAAN
jgi:hypothetical protein